MSGRSSQMSDPRRWIEAAVLGTGTGNVPNALLRMLASDVTMRRYAGALLWARLAAQTMPRALATLEAVLQDDKSGAGNRIAAVRLAAELAGLLTRAGDAAGPDLAGDGPELSSEKLIEVGREASERIARLEKRLTGGTVSDASVAPAW